MAGRFTELDEYFSPGLVLTVRGREYTLPLPSAELGLWCRRIAQVAGEVDASASEEELQEASARARASSEELPPLPGADRLSFEQLLLGPALDRMIADKVPDPYVKFCAQTAYIWVVGGEEAAQRYWVSGGRPEAQGPGNRAQRRAAARAAGGTSTAEAAATPSAASTSGTSTPTRSSGSGRGRRSRGRRSSPTGG